MTYSNAPKSILTSLKESDTLTLFSNSIHNQIKNLFKLAKKVNLDGIVCSPLELELANTVLDANSIKITPGIRDIDRKDDQARTMNAKDAAKQGATFLVIGRPITESNNPLIIIKRINNLLS